MAEAPGENEAKVLLCRRNRLSFGHLAFLFHFPGCPPPSLSGLSPLLTSRRTNDRRFPRFHLAMMFSRRAARALASMARSVSATPRTAVSDLAKCAHQQSSPCRRGFSSWRVVAMPFAKAVPKGFPVASDATSLRLSGMQRGGGFGALGTQRRSIFIQTQTTPNPASLMFLPGKPVLPDGPPVNFASAREGMKSPLAKRVFAIDGVTGVFFTTEYVTVTKNEDFEWGVLKPEVFAAIMVRNFPNHHAPPSRLPVLVLTKGALPLPITTTARLDYYDCLLIPIPHTHYERLTFSFCSTQDFYASGDLVVNDGDDLSSVNANTQINDDDSEIVAMIKELLETRIRPAVAEDGGDIVFKGWDEKTGTVTVKMQGACDGCPSSSGTCFISQIPTLYGVQSASLTATISAPE